MTYKPAGYSQGDASRFQWQNCVLATCTDLLDRSTVGAVRVAAPRLRTLSGDTSGGVTYSQAAAAAYKATTRIKLEPRYGLSREQVRVLGRAGIPFGISIDTAVTRATRFRTGTFVGGHTVYVQSYDDADNTWLVEDPGTTAEGYLNWPEDLLFRAAERRGGGAINVLVGRDTEGVSRTAIATGKIRSTADRTGTVKASIVVGRAYTVLSTTNGGSWERADGGVSYGWHRVRVGTTGSGYCRGEALR